MLRRARPPVPEIARPTAARLALLVAAALAAGPGSVRAQVTTTPTPTRVTVRAVAHDAKVIGTHVGGARITILDAASGDTLASGVQKGGTGDTDLIMRRPHERGRPVYDTPGTAGYTATLALSGPTRVRIVAEGPLGVPEALARASTSLLLLPGRDVTGDGIVLDLHGLAVTPEVPSTVPGTEIPVRATVTMLCGCTITPGGLWDAGGMQVRARLLRQGRVVAETALSYAGQASHFQGKVAAPAPGAYRLVVLASDPGRANYGRAERPVRVGGGS